MEGWLLERERGHGGEDVLVCVHLTCVKILVRWWTAWMDGVDGVLQLSLNWVENALSERHGPCTHRP